MTRIAAAVGIALALTGASAEAEACCSASDLACVMKLAPRGSSVSPAPRPAGAGRPVAAPPARRIEAAGVAGSVAARAAARLP